MRFQDFEGDELLLDKGQEFGAENMVVTPINGRGRQAFTVVNGGGHDLDPSSAPPSNAGSDNGMIEFTREDVEALLNEKAKRKDRFNYKVSYSLRFQGHWADKSCFCTQMHTWLC